jgi:hypothetical protein
MNGKFPEIACSRCPLAIVGANFSPIDIKVFHHVDGREE